MTVHPLNIFLTHWPLGHNSFDNVRYVILIHCHCTKSKNVNISKFKYNLWVVVVRCRCLGREHRTVLETVAAAWLASRSLGGTFIMHPRSLHLTSFNAFSAWFGNASYAYTLSLSLTLSSSLCLWRTRQLLV